MLKIFSAVYRKYKYDLYPKVSHIRGFTRISAILKQLSEIGVPKVSSSEAKSILSGDWKHLIIVDACRHDLYEELDKDNSNMVSRASATPEYIEKNFSSGSYDDVVYVTANPHFHPNRFEELTGRDVNSVFQCVFHTYQDKWDEKEGTVLPKKVYEDAKTAMKLFPDSRIVIHFMQPHYPFVKSNLTKKGIRPDLDGGKEGESVWVQAEKGEYDQEELWAHYKQNLEYVMETVEELVNELPGKTIITSDHGNLVGENDLYGHYTGSKAEPLRRVPRDIRDSR